MPEHKVHISWSSNRKTGHIPVSTSSSDTCPPSCKHLQLGTCYAKFSFLGMHWKKVDSDKVNNDWNHFLQFVSTLPSGQLWRHNQAGDLPGIGENIDKQALSQLINANVGKSGFTYTHKPLTSDNLKWIRYANKKGFTINLSCDNLIQASELFKSTDVPITVTVSETFPMNRLFMNDVKYVTCPAQVEDTITCKQCQWCAMPNRTWIIMFKMHGSKRKDWK
jgi:hypothetical protein